VKYTDLLVIGLGSVGGALLEQAAREPSLSSIVAADIREDYGQKKVNTEAAGAIHLGYFPDMKFQKVDMLDEIEKLAEILTEINPRVIVSATTMMTPWVRGLLPDDVMRPLYQAGGLGPWIAFHLRYVHRLMQAIKLANLSTRVINTSYPDAVCPALRSVGLAPLTGGGNVDSIAVMVQLKVARDHNVKPADVRIYLVSHHYNNRWLAGGAQGERCGDKPAPYFLKVMVGDRDVTNSYDEVELLRFGGCGVGRVDGSPGISITSSSMLKHALAALHDSNLFTHTCGPSGLPGGYPIRLGWDEAKLELPSGITREEAINMNLAGQVRDGIEEIRDDGTIVFTEPVYEAVKEVFGFDCRSFKVSELDAVAEEQMRKFKETSEKYRGRG